MELRQQDAEDQRRGWVLWKEVKWHKLQVKLKHRLSIQQREKELKVAEMDVCICEPEQWPVFGEEEDEAADESQIFKTNEWFVSAGTEECEDVQGTMSWFEDTSTDEVPEILEAAMQD